MSLCLAGAGVAVSIAAQAFSLAWTHTIERTEWREDWRVDGDVLVLEVARVKGSGAGMEPPPGAQLENGFYVWRPEIRMPAVVLRRDPHAGDWTLCAAGRCDMLGVWLKHDGDPVTLVAARDGAECMPARDEDGRELKAGGGNRSGGQ